MLQGGSADLVLALVGGQQDGVSTSPHDPGEASSPCLALNFLTSKVPTTLTRGALEGCCENA